MAIQTTAACCCIPSGINDDLVSTRVVNIKWVASILSMSAIIDCGTFLHFSFRPTYRSLPADYDVQIFIRQNQTTWMLFAHLRSVRPTNSLAVAALAGYSQNIQTPAARLPLGIHLAGEHNRHNGSLCLAAIENDHRR